MLKFEHYLQEVRFSKVYFILWNRIKTLNKLAYWQGSLCVGEKINKSKIKINKQLNMISRRNLGLLAWFELRLGKTQSNEWPFWLIHSQFYNLPFDNT